MAALSHSPLTENGSGETLRSERSRKVVCVKILDHLEEVVAYARRAKSLGNCLVRNGLEGVREVNEGEDVTFHTTRFFQEATHHVIIFVTPVVGSKSLLGGGEGAVLLGPGVEAATRRLV